MNHLRPTRRIPGHLHRAALAIGMACCVWAAPAQAGASPVAEVTLMVGEAVVFRLDGSNEALRRGMPIRVGDRIETAGNGHVHMRFADNGAVSIRPDSIFEIQAFQFNKQDPKSNEVRFRVDRGTARSISGAATDQDKTRFRLNTPIAAIGVRGTDFIVRTDVDGVRATVADGTIVVGALGPGCLAQAVGPCRGADVRELSADMGRVMAEVKTGDQVTRIVPALDTFAGQGATERDQGSRRLAMAAARSSGIAAAEPTPSELLHGNDTAAAALLTLATVNLPDLNRASSLDAQLVWGRWGVFGPGGDQVSVPFSLARLDRHVTVADEDFGLFRTNAPAGGPSFSDLKAGVVDFRLNRATAFYAVGAVEEKAAISAGSLSIDFGRRTFATGLDMATASGVTGELRVAGEIRTDGIFSVRDAEQRVSGAVSHDGKEAGYLFERAAGAGLFRGVTLWGK